MSAIVEKFLSENQLVEHDAIQGTPEWESMRLNLDGSSEIGSVLGLKKKPSREELKYLKYSGNKQEFSQWVIENILNHGHEVEAAARPLVEAALGKMLYPVMYSRGRISASCDGLTAAGDTAWEHKQWNTEYASLVANNILPEEHAPQCYQILLITGAYKLIFTISDGTSANMVSMEVMPDPKWFERIILGWAQFNKELAEYVPPVEVAKPVPAVVGSLPAVKWNLQGTQITSNLEKEVKPAVLSLIEKYTFTPQTDQDFADLKAFGENARDAVAKSKVVRETVLANLSDINAFNAGMLELEELLTKAAINAENVYKAENINRKNHLRAKGQARFDKYIHELQASIHGVIIAFATPDLAAATKNLRTLKSFGDAVETCVSNAIIAADAMAADVRAKLAWCKENAAGHSALFPDLQALMAKPMEDFTLTITSRIDKHKADEAAKLEAVRVQAEADARVKIEAEAKSKAEAELATKQIYGAEQAQQERIKADAPSKVIPIAKNPSPAPSREALAKVIAFEYGVEINVAMRWLKEAFSEVAV